MAIELTKRLFTVDEYERMIEAGILTENDRVELVEGEIIEMGAKGSRHAACVKRITDLFYRYARQSAVVSVQDPIRVGIRSELEPDVALLKLRDDLYADRLPEAGDVLLVVEVSDTTLAYDRRTKLGLYAKGGLTEVWIVDLTAETVEVYTQPEGGKYGAVKHAKRGETIEVSAVHGVVLGVSDILG